MKLLVTGGAGFIGSNYVRHLVGDTDHEIVVLDALTYAGNLDNLSGVLDSPRVEFIHGNICDRETVRRAMSGCHQVVHFAAESHVDRSLLDPDVFMTTNAVGTNVMCSIATELGVDRFVHISTDEVYGSIEVGSFSEVDPLHPRSPYSAAKAASDMIALAYFETYGLPVVVTRSSNQFGPYQFPEKVIPLFITNLERNERVPLYGDGQNVRDWLFVRDNCNGVELVRQFGVTGEIYNIGAGNELSNLEMTMKILNACGADETAIEYVPDRQGHDRRYSIDTRKVSALGWAPQVALNEALELTVQWYRDNRTWWEPLLPRVKNR